MVQSLLKEKSAPKVVIVKSVHRNKKLVKVDSIILIKVAKPSLIAYSVLEDNTVKDKHFPQHLEIAMMVGTVELVQQSILNILQNQDISLYQEIINKLHVMLENTTIFGIKIRALIVQLVSIALT